MFKNDKLLVSIGILIYNWVESLKWVINFVVN